MTGSNEEEQQVVVILGTGGTIAGAAGASAEPGDDVNYTAGQVGVAQLIGAVPGLRGLPLTCEQIAQVDSKDMDFALWQRLAARCRHWLARPEVRAIVITHGTDTLEETAYFLTQVLPAGKAVVLTCAMRPATAPNADGPRNLLDAVTLARDAGAATAGVLMVCAGQVHGALEVQKVHTQRPDAFSSGEAGPLARIDQNAVSWERKVPNALVQRSSEAIEKIVNAVRWPRVEIVLNHVGAGRLLVDSLVAAGVDGIVAAGTGNGTLRNELEAALEAAQAAGVRVVRATRCVDGAVRPRVGDPFEPSAGLSAVKARVALLLDLLGGADAGSGTASGRFGQDRSGR